MPSIRHEIPLQLLRHRPELAPQIARAVLGLPVPDLPCWRPGTETVTLLSPGELHLDVVLVGATADKPEFAIVHEVQNSCGTSELERIALSWPAYVTHHDYISKCVPVRYRKEWEELVAIAIENYHWESDFAREHQAIGRAEGRAEGQAEALSGSVLRILERRGLAVGETVRARVTDCSDLAQLTGWLDLALVVDSAEKIFGDEADLRQGSD
ncbi:hypothetical protein ACFYUD_04565 [Nocardia tengchongensis]|uniref:hypothetical protein n=1 Tax=Nocardia tengchongensis TaxID=2055889 RepID=UPI00368C4A26